MNELQKAILYRLGVLSWFVRHKSQKENRCLYKMQQTELFRQAEEAGIINQWKRNEDAMRAEFEQWVDNEHMCNRRSEPGYDKEYEHPWTRGAWAGWRRKKP
jgi:hypothetical protein